MHAPLDEDAIDLVADSVAEMVRVMTGDRSRERYAADLMDAHRHLRIGLRRLLAPPPVDAAIYKVPLNG